MTGCIHGVGLGPGDPDLMSVRALRLISSATHVAYFRKRGRAGQARRIVQGLLAENVREIPMEYPVTTEVPVTDPAYNQMLSAFYGDCTGQLRGFAEAGRDVAVLCEGDPFFYGSFMHLYSRLQGKVPVEVVPAITGMSAAWTATGQPITWGDDVMTVLMGTLPEEILARHILAADALVIMKIGRHFARVRRALRKAGRESAAWLVEHAAMPDQRARRLLEVEDASVPYFSIIVVHGQGRRP